MYTLDKLKNMSILLGSDTVDGELASYFINNLNNLSKMTLQKCIHETGISKASIHRFYSKAGFINFKNFISVLSEELKEENDMDLNLYKIKLNYFINNYDFTHVDQSSLVNKLMNADQILIYSNIRDTYNLTTTINYLRSLNKKVKALGKWDISSNYEMIETLKENDVFIIINRTLNIQNFHEMSINHDYLLNIEKMREIKCHKFFIGQGNGEEYLDFKLVKIPDLGEEMSLVIMNTLDKYLKDKLSKR